MHNLNIQHDISHGLFFTKVKGGMAQLSYEKVADKHLRLMDVHVPVSSKGMGVRRHLIESALSYAKGRDMVIESSHPLVREIMDGSKEYQCLKVRE